MMNLATFIDSTDRWLDRAWLGQQPQTRDFTGDEAAAWEAYFRAIRGQMIGAWNRSLQSFEAYRKIREDLGLPAVAAPTEAGGESAIDPQLYAQAAQLGQMVQLGAGYIDDVLANRRRVSYTDTQGLVIEALPTDTMRIEMIAPDPSRPTSIRPVLVDATGNVMPPAAGATPESVGMLSFGWAAAVAIVVVAVAAYFAITAACDAWTQTTRSKAMETVSGHWSAQVEKGNATPEQAKAAVQSVFSGAAQVTQAEAAVQTAKAAPSGLEKTVTTLLWVGLGIAVLYTALQLVPRRAAAVAA